MAVCCSADLDVEVSDVHLVEGVEGGQEVGEVPHHHTLRQVVVMQDTLYQLTARNPGKSENYKLHYTCT